MHRNVRNALIAICCTGLFAMFGCSNTGEMSVNGFYQSRVGGLSGNECDDILMQAAEAEGEDREAMKDEYRECIEEAIEEQGGDAQCRDGEDETCDLILEEVEDAIDAVRAERGNEMPDCDDPQSNGDAALCHLMEAYEVCQLDHDGDGEPDVDRMPPEACEELEEQAETDAEAQEILDEHPECKEGDEGEDGDEGEEGDEPKEGDEGGESDEPKEGEDSSESDEPKEGEHDEGGESDKPEEEEGADHEEGGETTEDGSSEEGGESTEEEADNHDQFCEDLLEEKAACDTDACREEIAEIYERECVI